MGVRAVEMEEQRKPTDQEESMPAMTDEAAEVAAPSKLQPQGATAAAQAIAQEGAPRGVAGGGAAAAGGKRPGMRWYVVHANTGHENKVRRNIEQSIRAQAMQEYFGEVLVVTQEVTEMRNGKRVTTKRKFFPSYILVEMVLNDDTRHFMSNIPGVTRFVGSGDKPTPISEEEVDRILGRIKKGEEKTIQEIPYQVGDAVEVIDGPFSDFTGVVNEINPDKGKLKVMVSIFGRETPVELDFLQVKAI
jgi:transcriptional antiterminator NusG